MTPEEIRIALAEHFPQLIPEPRTSPDGWSFFLGEVRRGPNSTRIFHANRSSPGAVTMVRLPVSRRVLGDGEYYEAFTGNIDTLLQLVTRELQLYNDNL
jgi:hypothetical protein